LMPISGNQKSPFSFPQDKFVGKTRVRRNKL
jgi:hypothetical protein